jgi:hypothetical protein
MRSKDTCIVCLPDEKVRGILNVPVVSGDMQLEVAKTHPFVV